MDLLSLARGAGASLREHIVGMYGEPGTHMFKAMVRRGEWKYIWIANGGAELLFNLAEDPCELRDLSADRRDLAAALRDAAAAACDAPGARDALDGGKLRAFAPQQPYPRRRCRQFDYSRGVRDWPARPQDVLEEFKRRHS